MYLKKIIVVLCFLFIIGSVTAGVISEIEKKQTIELTKEEVLVLEEKNLLNLELTDCIVINDEYCRVEDKANWELIKIDVPYSTGVDIDTYVKNELILLLKDIVKEELEIGKRPVYTELEVAKNYEVKEEVSAIR